ncbi:hypothetical protein [Chlorobaculum limnaeum]|uniref:hypothetical protein n=1 Tax=Chlorobaculum limnaeum TaxID=274537 RepID=UPI001969FD58|nr:hypothetical protein [Chlorobaculum limnaeum]
MSIFRSPDAADACRNPKAIAIIRRIIHKQPKGAVAGRRAGADLQARDVPGSQKY